MEDFSHLYESDYVLREDKQDEFRDALRKYGLFQVTDEGFEYFFVKKEESCVLGR